VGRVLAIGLVIVLSGLAGAGPDTAVGNTDPGALVRIGTPLLRLLVDIAGTVCALSLAFVACCTRPRSSEHRSATGYAALRTACRWAAVWWLAALALVPVDAADLARAMLSSFEKISLTRLNA
jgi:putative copper resistance protein D